MLFLEYIATDSCEKLDLEANNLKWKMTSWSLPGPSYSHAATCVVTQKKNDKSLNKVRVDEWPKRVNLVIVIEGDSEVSWRSLNQQPSGVACQVESTLAMN